MLVAQMILEYLRVVLWPTVVILALFKYGAGLLAALQRSHVKLSLFGVEVDADISRLEQILTAPVGGSLTPQQWLLLERIEATGSVSVKAERYDMSMSGDLAWIRPVRNAGLLKTLPDGQYIEQATEMVLSPLGRLLMDARRGQREDATPSFSQ